MTCVSTHSSCTEIGIGLRADKLGIMYTRAVWCFLSYLSSVVRLH